MAEEWCHKGREELQLSSPMDVPIPPLCNPRKSQQEAEELAVLWSSEELQPWGAAQLSVRARRAPHKGTPHKVRKALQIPAKSHYHND